MEDKAMVRGQPREPAGLLQCCATLRSCSLCAAQVEPLRHPVVRNFSGWGVHLLACDHLLTVTAASQHVRLQEHGMPLGYCCTGKAANACSDIAAAAAAIHTPAAVDTCVTC